MNRKLVPILCIVLILAGCVVTGFGVKNLLESRTVSTQVVYDWEKVNEGMDNTSGGTVGNVSSNGVVTATPDTEGVEIGNIPETESSVANMSELNESESERE